MLEDRFDEIETDRAIKRGLADVKAGRVYTAGQLKAKLSAQYGV
jgi:predicted transcriptional regulator